MGYAVEDGPFETLEKKLSYASQMRSSAVLQEDYAVSKTGIPNMTKCQTNIFSTRMGPHTLGKKRLDCILFKEYPDT